MKVKSSLKLIILINIGLLSLFSLRNRFDIHFLEKAKSRTSVLPEINKRFNIIETELTKSNPEIACSEATISRTLIKTNLNKLKTIEPKYDWNEISEVLDRISKELC